MPRKARSHQKKLEKSKPRGMKLLGPAIILLAAAAALWLHLLTGPSCSNDFYFHFVSWSEAQRSILQGLLYPHWANTPNFGFGEPRFVFYPPLTWMAGAWMGLVLPWKSVSLALGFLLLAAAGLANRALAREVLSDGPATLAGCASIYLGREIFDLNARYDYAELTGGFWIPLLLLFLLRNRNPSGRFWERVFDGSTFPLALVIGGVWLSTVPLGIEANYLMAATALVSAALQKAWTPVVRATIGGALGMGLTSIYLVPAVWERSWVNLRAAVSDQEYRIESNWLFAKSADPTMLHHDALLLQVSVIAVAMFAMTLISALVAWKRGSFPEERRLWVPLVLIPIAVFFLSLPVSLPVWNWLPGLRYLQFPWRWLLVMQPSLAIFFASAVWFVPLSRRLLALTACAMLFFPDLHSRMAVLSQRLQEIRCSSPKLGRTRWGGRKARVFSPGHRVPSSLARRTQQLCDQRS